MGDMHIEDGDIKLDSAIGARSATYCALLEFQIGAGKEHNSQ